MICAALFIQADGEPQDSKPHQLHPSGTDGHLSQDGFLDSALRNAVTLPIAMQLKSPVLRILIIPLWNRFFREISCFCSCLRRTLSISFPSSLPNMPGRERGSDRYMCCQQADIRSSWWTSEWDRDLINCPGKEKRKEGGGGSQGSEQTSRIQLGSEMWGGI